MAILSGIIKAKRYRLLESGDYQLESAWTSSQTVFMDNGDTLEKTVKTVNNSITSANKSITSINNSLQPIIQNVTEIKVVSSLPSDASSHPTTLYITTS